jgi:hypothetical protein
MKSKHRLNALLSGKKKKHGFALNANDALVQISLPLVLILAIATRLMVIGQQMAEEEQGPKILDIWKQQLILRIDSLMNDWEKESYYNKFNSAADITWQDSYPNDEFLQTLCINSKILDTIPKISTNFYIEALAYQPTSLSTNESSGTLTILYDAELSKDIPEGTEKEYIITQSHRQYALDHIEKRCLMWQSNVENLQWDMIANIAAKQPIEDIEITDKELAVQMQKIAYALKIRNYPILNSIQTEYGTSNK